MDEIARDALRTSASSTQTEKYLSFEEVANSEASRSDHRESGRHKA